MELGVAPVILGLLVLYVAASLLLFGFTLVLRGWPIARRVLVIAFLIIPWRMGRFIAAFVGALIAIIFRLEYARSRDEH